MYYLLLVRTRMRVGVGFGGLGLVGCGLVATSGVVGNPSRPKPIKNRHNKTRQNKPKNKTKENKTDLAPSRGVSIDPVGVADFVVGAVDDLAERQAPGGRLAGVPIRLTLAQLSWVGLGWVGWAGLGWLSWVGLGWTG